MLLCSPSISASPPPQSRTQFHSGPVLQLFTVTLSIRCVNWVWQAVAAATPWLRFGWNDATAVHTSLKSFSSPLFPFFLHFLFSLVITAVLLWGTVQMSSQEPFRACEVQLVDLLKISSCSMSHSLLPSWSPLGGRPVRSPDKQSSGHIVLQSFRKQATGSLLCGTVSVEIGCLLVTEPGTEYVGRHLLCIQGAILWRLKNCSVGRLNTSLVQSVECRKMWDTDTGRLLQQRWFIRCYRST